MEVAGRHRAVSPERLEKGDGDVSLPHELRVHRIGLRRGVCDSEGGIRQGSRIQGVEWSSKFYVFPVPLEPWNPRTLPLSNPFQKRGGWGALLKLIGSPQNQTI
jgi:hypothetical protein